MRRPLSYPFLALSIIILAALALVRAAPADSGSDSDAVALERREILFGGGAGTLPVHAAFTIDDLTDGGLSGRLQVDLDLSSLAVDSLTVMRVSLVAEGGDSGVILRHREVEVAELSRAGRWFYQSRLEVPEDVLEVAVVVEALPTGRWGGVSFGLDDPPIDRPLTAAVVVAESPWSLVDRAEADSRPGGAARAAAPRRSTALRLLPPTERELSGAVRFEALVADVGVDRVTFELDGKQVAERKKRPYSSRLELAGPGTPQIVRAVAYDRAGGVLGADELEVNADLVPFRVRLASVSGSAEEGAVEAEVAVTVPASSRLDRVELYWNENEVARFSEPPYRARFDVDAEGGYVRAVAHLADGTWAEDVSLLGVGGAAGEIDVTLVELYVVVTDKDGGPVEGLGREDFSIRLAGKPQAVERHSFADDVPLELGLVIDTSESMEGIIQETKQAAAQFLGQTLSAIDRAFLVDFDTLPRLAYPMSGSVMDLVSGMATLQASGATAMFDSIIFSMLEFPPGRGRRALVLLTDGDDYRSRFGPNRCVRLGRDLGVPVYIVSLADPGRLTGGARASGRDDLLELEAVTGKTGGRLYFVAGFDELRRAYAEINRELRSQHLLTFYVDGELSAEERDSIEVSVAGQKKSQVRVVVSAS